MDKSKSSSSKSALTLNRTIILSVLCVLMLGARQSKYTLAGFNWVKVPDPLGDVFGVDPQHDVNFLYARRDASNLTLVMSFVNPITPPFDGVNQVSGYIDLDTDQNNLTGATSHLLPYTQCQNPLLGVEYYIDLTSY